MIYHKNEFAQFLLIAFNKHDERICHLNAMEPGFGFAAVSFEVWIYRITDLFLTVLITLRRAFTPQSKLPNLRGSRREIFYCLCLTFLLTATQVAARKTDYGTELDIKREAVWSPDRRFKVETIPHLYLKHVNDYHRSRLFLIRRGLKRQIPIVMDETNGYDHFVEVLWSPNSKAFAVNLWDPGRTADCYLYNVNSMDQPIRIDKVLTRLIKDKKQKKVFSDITFTARGPIIVATRWLSSGWLKIHIEDDRLDDAGHISETFSLNYRWNLKDKLIFEPGKTGKTIRCTFSDHTE
jgi:hypothetical protein